MLKVSAFYIEKQKSSIPKKNFLGRCQYQIKKALFTDSIFQKVLKISIWKITIYYRIHQMVSRIFLETEFVYYSYVLLMYTKVGDYTTHLAFFVYQSNVFQSSVMNYVVQSWKLWRKYYTDVGQLILKRVDRRCTVLPIVPNF